MKTNLPESRNRNLPAPIAPAAVPSRRPTVPPESPKQGPGPLRSALVLLLMAGLVGTGIWYFIRRSTAEVEQLDKITSALTAMGDEIWGLGSSSALSGETDEARLELADLPRVILGIKSKLGKTAFLKPKIEVVPGDTPGGRGVASHFMSILVNGQRILIIRIRFDAPTLRFYFVSAASPLVPSYQDIQRLKKAGADAVPGGALPSPPAPPPPVPAATSDLPAGSPAAGTSPPVSTTPTKTEKVSEQP